MSESQLPMVSIDDVSEDDRPSRVAAANDKRRHNRVPVEVDIDFSSESNFYNGFTENISEGGVFVATYELKPMGEKVTMKFRLPDSEETIECEGEVRWIRVANQDTPDVSPGLGLQFVNMSPELQARVDAFIREREPMFFDD
jgi:uncharacterized protein (TIGR02266 family)